MRATWVSGLVVLGLLTGCGGSRECRLDDPKTCPQEQICEQVQGGGKPMCFQPVQIEGKVFDLASGAGIEGAQVTALDANGAPAGSVAVTGKDGRYALRVPSLRTDDKGAFVGKKITLRASATNYQTFPSGLRVSLPIDTAAAARSEESQPFVLEGGLTDIGLIALPDAEKNRPSISGTVAVAAGQKGVLVVAESSSPPGYSAIADDSGAFKIFNVPPGTYKVQAYSRRASYTAVDVTVAQGQDATGVKLERSGAPTATVSGTVQLVSGAAGPTSVVMVVESTFNQSLVRGEVPPGLRAPEPGTAPNVSGAWSIDGVPDGKYVVLAAFENDGNVRDPDPKISGTQLQRLTVANGQASLQPAFKVTGAIQMVSPGAGDAIDTVSGQPKLTWKPYSSAKSYTVTLFDQLGEQKWQKDVLAITGSDVSVTYDGPALTSGGVYQWRATAIGNLNNPISQTEDLRGVFLFR